MLVSAEENGMRLSMAGLLFIFCSQAPAQFEVAAIRLNTGGGPGRGNIGAAPGGRVIVTNVPVRLMIRFAYNIQDFQISGGPSWMNTDNYDVNAKAPGNVPFQQVRPLVQSLLEDRFKLVVHHETKEMPVYELVPAKGGLKVTMSKEGSCVVPDPKNLPKPGDPLPHFCGNTGIRPNLIEAYGVPMGRFVAALSNVLGRTVIDKSGVTGNVDINLEFAPDEINPSGAAGPGATAASDSSKPSIFSAIQEQLGMKLESAKAPGDMLVIDHLERPSEN
jgi:uncharacterized protein (TIGR03435 family)